MMLLVIDNPYTNLEQLLYFEGRLKGRLVRPRLGRSNYTYLVIVMLASIEIVVTINARRMSILTGKIRVE